MSSDRLLQNIVSILLMAGYNVSERCEIRPRSFDLMASNGENLVAIKVVSQIDSISEEVAWDLDKIARHLHAVPLIIGERARDLPLERGAIYLRYGINAVSAATLYDYLAEGEFPLVYASPGGMYVKIDADRLREIRESMAMSLGDLANALGVSRRTVSKYESGMGTTLDMALRLEEFFNDGVVKPIDLLSYTPVEEKQTLVSLPSAHTADESAEKPEDHLRLMGINVHEFKRSPFHAVSVFENETILTCYGSPQKTVERAEFVSSISQISGTHSLCVVTDYGKEKKIGKTVVIGDKRLKDLEDGEELLEIVMNEKR